MSEFSIRQPWSYVFAGVLFLLLFHVANRPLNAQATISPQKANADNLLKIARGDNELVVRITAIDVLGQLAGTIVPTKDKISRELFRPGSRICLNNFPQQTDKIYADRSYFRIHVAQALAKLGADANEVLPDLVRAKGQTAHLDRELDVAIATIVTDYSARNTPNTPPPPPKATVDPKATTVAFATPTVVSGSPDSLTMVVKDTSGNSISGLDSNAFQFSLSGGKSGNLGSGDRIGHQGHLHHCLHRHDRGPGHAQHFDCQNQWHRT